jgi:hypothetical protein
MGLDGAGTHYTQRQWGFAFSWCKLRSKYRAIMAFIYYAGKRTYVVVPGIVSLKLFRVYDRGEVGYCMIYHNSYAMINQYIMKTGQETFILSEGNILQYSIGTSSGRQ